MFITVGVTTDYTSHLISGKGLIKAVATGKGLGRTVNTVPFSHAMNPELNHQGASYAVVDRLVKKLTGKPMDPTKVSRTRDHAANGHQRWTYTVEV
jgi:hypothetical protein